MLLMMATLVLLMMRMILSQVMLPAMTMIPMLWVVMPQQIFGTPLCSVSLVLSLSTTFILLLELITGPQTLSNGHGQSQKGMILDWVNSYAHICVLFTAFNSQVGDINTHVPLLQVRELMEEKKLDTNWLTGISRIHLMLQSWSVRLM